MYNSDWFLRRILEQTTLLIERLDLMALDLTTLQAAVAQETQLEQSLISLLTQLATELQTASDAGDQAAINDIVAKMQSNASAMSQAVVANTPAAPAPEPVVANAPTTTDGYTPAATVT